jgi:hypothetical protein
MSRDMTWCVVQWCSAMWCDVLYDIVWCGDGEIQCGKLWYDVVCCRVVEFDVCDGIQCCSMIWCVAVWCGTLCVYVFPHTQNWKPFYLHT